MIAAHGICHASAEAAAAYACGTAFPTTNGDTYTVCTGSGETFLNLATHTPGGSTTYSVPAPAAPCTAMTWPDPLIGITPADASLLGAAVVAVWITAWVFRMVTRTVQDTDRSD